MNCPVCGSELREVQKYNISIDICPSCKGVWLDRGELDKIIEAAAYGAPSGRRDDDHDDVLRDRATFDRHDDDDHDEHRSYGRDEHGQRYGNRKRRGSWLSNLLEGFGGDD